MMDTEVYDTVSVETLSVNDLVQIAGYCGVVRGVEDMGTHVVLTWYNEDTDEMEEDSMWAGSKVDLIMYV